MRCASSRFAKTERGIPCAHKALYEQFGKGCRLARGQRRPFVLVDWTQIRGDFSALVASVPFSGRSIPIFAQAYEHGQLGATEAHLAFLNELRQIVPRDCRAVIIADGH